MDLYSKIVLFFQHGGEFMYPIALVMAIGVAISLERYFYLARQTSVNRRDYEKILPLLRAQRMREIQDLASKSKSAVCAIVTEGIARLSHTRRRQDIEYAMEEQLLEVLPNIERRTPYLATFANVATLLGLLGTVIGLIGAFTAVASADPAEKASLLSQSISVSMNCTAFGSDGRHSVAVAALDAAEQDQRHRREPRDRSGQVPQSARRPTGTPRSTEGGTCKPRDREGLIGAFPKERLR